jgi:hypothetical protein
MTASDPVLNRRLYRICRTAMSRLARAQPQLWARTMPQPRNLTLKCASLRLTYNRQGFGMDALSLCAFAGAKVIMAVDVNPEWLCWRTCQTRRESLTTD